MATLRSTGMMFYNSTTSEVQFITASKTFVIDHPHDKERYLVHACLEGPESGVYYRGKGEITNSEFVRIDLPPYVDALATDFTVHLTSIGPKPTLLSASEVEHGSFIVYGSNARFHWIVHGMREEVDVEPNKSKTKVKGSGPYKWI